MQKHCNWNEVQIYLCKQECILCYCESNAEYFPVLLFSIDNVDLKKKAAKDDHHLVDWVIVEV